MPAGRQGPGSSLDGEPWRRRSPREAGKSRRGHAADNTHCTARIHESQRSQRRRALADFFALSFPRASLKMVAAVPTGVGTGVRPPARCRHSLHLFLKLLTESGAERVVPDGPGRQQPHQRGSGPAAAGTSARRPAAAEPERPRSGGHRRRGAAAGGPPEVRRGPQAERGASALVDCFHRVCDDVAHNLNVLLGRRLPYPAAGGAATRWAFARELRSLGSGASARSGGRVGSKHPAAAMGAG